LAIIRDIYAAVLTRPLNNSPVAQASADEILRGLAEAQDDAGASLQTAELHQVLSVALREYWSGTAKGETIDARGVDVLAEARNLVYRL